MVEVAIAILVVSVGLLAVFGLFGDALDINKSTVADTQSALFAEEVLNGFKAAAQNITNATPSQWATAVQGIILTNPPWWDPAYIKVGSYTNQYKYTPQSGSMGKLTDFSCRYTLGVTNVANNVAGVTLSVWPLGVATNAPLRFYTEVYNYGM